MKTVILGLGLALLGSGLYAAEAGAPGGVPPEKTTLEARKIDEAKQLITRTLPRIAYFEKTLQEGRISESLATNIRQRLADAKANLEKAKQSLSGLTGATGSVPPEKTTLEARKIDEAKQLITRTLPRIAYFEKTLQEGGISESLATNIRQRLADAKANLEKAKQSLSELIGKKEAMEYYKQVSGEK